MSEDQKQIDEQYDQDGRTGQYDQTESIVFGRTKPITDEDLTGMDAEPSTAKCSKMESAINARTANLDAAARKLKSGPPDNQYGL